MAFNRLFLDGDLASGAERFSIGVAFAGADGTAVSGSPALSTWAEATRALLAPNTGYSGTLRAMIGASGRYLRVRTYEYATPTGPAVAAGASTGAAIAGSSLTVQPPQVAAVATLNTGIPGRRTRGRMYFPAQAATMGTNGKWTGNPSHDSFALAVANFLGAVSDLVSSPEGFGPVVVSAAGGLVTPVTSVSAGDVLDTQRRRRDALLETRYTAPLP